MIYLAQILCPRRHAIVGYAIDMAEGFAAEVEAQLVAIKDRLLAERTINPWCGICHAPAAAWHCEVGKTAFASMDEARPALEEGQRQQMLTRQAIDAQKRKARLN